MSIAPALSSPAARAHAAPTSPAPRAHYPRLDGLRGIAILAVMLFHLTPLTETFNPALLAFRSVMRLGWMGVDLFFVLSGFLITGILLDSRGTARRWTTFYARRTLRIFPLYYAALAGLAVYYAAHPDPRVPDTAWLPWCLGYLSNLSRFVPSPPTMPSGTWHFWSLAVEEQFYLLWPLVVWRTTPTRLLRVSAVLVALAILTRLVLLAAFDPSAAYATSFARMDALVLGAVLAVWRRDPAAWARARRWASAVGGAAALVVLGIVSFHPDEASGVGSESLFCMELIGFTLVAVAAAAAVVRAADGPATGWLARGPLPWLGRYAYGLYVYHWFVVVFILPAMFRAGWIWPAPDYAAGRGTVVSIVVGFPLSVALAVASYHWFEAPFLRLKRWFPASPPAPPVVAGALRTAGAGAA